MIGYFGDVIFETSDRRICTFNNMKRTISASYSEHNRYKKKSEREFEGPKNQSVSFKMKFVAGHGVRPWKWNGMHVCPGRPQGRRRKMDD